MAVPARLELSELESAFVTSFVRGGDAEASALKAGVAKDKAYATAYRLLSRPNVLAAIHSETRRALISDAPISVKVLRDLRDKATSEKVRADAARTLLDRAGFIAPRAIAEKNGADIALNEMSLGELRSLADSLEGELATRAKPANGAAAIDPTSQAIDTLA